jgi:hypothetical protein
MSQWFPRHEVLDEGEIVAERLVSIARKTPAKQRKVAKKRLLSPFFHSSNTLPPGRNRPERTGK